MGGTASATTYATMGATRIKCDRAETATDQGTQYCNYQYGTKAVGNVNIRSCTVEEVHQTKQYEETVECSNRGTCDTSSGACTCFEGFAGEACHEQTVFF